MGWMDGGRGGWIWSDLVGLGWTRRTGRTVGPSFAKSVTEGRLVGDSKVGTSGAVFDSVFTIFDFWTVVFVLLDHFIREK